MYEQILLLVSLIVFVLFLYQLTFKSRGNLPPGPSAHRHLGFIPLIFRANTVEKIFDIIKEFLAEYNGLVYMGSFVLGGFFFTSKPEYLEVIFQKDVLEKPDALHQHLQGLLGRGLLIMNGETWKTRSKMAAPVFRTKNLHIIHETIQRYTERLIEKLNPVADGQNRNLDHIFSENGFRLTFEALAGYEEEIPNSKEIDELIEYVEQCIGLTNYKYTHFLSATILHKLGYKWFLESKLNDIFQTFINLIKTVTPQEYNFNRDHQTYKKVLYPNLAEDEFKDEIKDLMGASYETTKSALVLTLAMLAMFPQEQERVCEEQSDIFGDSMRPADLEDLSQMKYLEACIHETLRLFPIVSVVARTLTSDAQIGNYCLPKGTIAVIPIPLLQRDPDSWIKPDDFYPQHFLNQELIKNRSKYAFIPFSAGPRECVGKKYAMTVMKTMLSQMVRTYHISTDANNLDDIKVLRLFTLDTRSIQVKLKPKITC